MAASSNESFGLKIATALSIALTVVLLVVVYFLNSSYQLELEKNTKSVAALDTATKEQRRLTSDNNAIRDLLGYSGVENFDDLKAAAKKDQEAIKADIQSLTNEITQAVTDFQKKVEGKNVDPAQYEAIKTRTREIVDAYVNNTDQSYKASLVRLKDLTLNQSRLTAFLAMDYIDVKQNLMLANKVNSDAKKVVEEGLANARAELDATIKKGEEARQALVADQTAKAEAIAAADTKYTDTVNKFTTDVEGLKKEKAALRANVSDYIDKAALKENVMSKPGGRVTYVNYEDRTIRMSVNKTQGVRPLMRFTIFDKNSVGITSDKPKGVVEIVRVGDPAVGEADSLARIIQTFDPADPIRYNDYIFSVGWSYDHPQRFDLIGKIDINRDGRDDRGDLIRMIEAAGGVVEYDLPPPNVDRGPGIAAVERAYKRIGQPVPANVGRASGKISGLAYAYVTDRRTSTVLFQKKVDEGGKEETAFLADESQATKEARDNGVRPLPLEKLLNMLGYDYQNPIEGRREAVDRSSIKQLLKAKGAGPGAPATKPGSEAESKDMP